MRSSDIESPIDAVDIDVVPNPVEDPTDLLEDMVASSPGGGEEYRPQAFMDALADEGDIAEQSIEVGLGEDDEDYR